MGAGCLIGAVSQPKKAKTATKNHGPHAPPAVGLRSRGALEVGLQARRGGSRGATGTRGKQ